MDKKHEHECGCEGGCCCENEMQEYETVTLTYDNGDSEDFAVIDQFEIDGNEYVALLAVEEDSPLGEDIVIFKYIEGEDNNFTLEIIEDDDEFEKACDYFESLTD